MKGGSSSHVMSTDINCGSESIYSCTRRGIAKGYLLSLYFLTYTVLTNELSPLTNIMYAFMVFIRQDIWVGGGQSLWATATVSRISMRVLYVFSMRLYTTFLGGEGGGGTEGRGRGNSRATLLCMNPMH